MSIFDLFSKRQKKLPGEVPHVYTYDKIPQPLKVQIVHIWRDTLGDVGQYHQERRVYDCYKCIVETLCREYGVFKLPGAEEYSDRNYFVELANFLLQEQNAEKALDAIELSLRVVDRFTRDYGYQYRHNASELADTAIEELKRSFS